MRKHILKFSLKLGVALFLWVGCDNATQPGQMVQDFSDLQVGQEWNYLRWEKRHFEEPVITQDWATLKIVDRNSNTVTFQEVVYDSASEMTDTSLITFQIVDSNLVLFGATRSRLFGFLESHNGILPLTRVDSNLVNVNIDSLPDIAQKTGKPRFMGHASKARILNHEYSNLTFFYDSLPIVLDAPGTGAFFSPQQGLVSVVRFDGYSLFEHTGYLLKP
ncbi:MAG: hypothetical protein D6748_07940 [Calditrichaeota bacterium]|nr:MAG: hypothetical protein D6748_07940 [Calditrichota bacterium]